MPAAAAPAAADPEREDRIADLLGRLEHTDPSQLAFQVLEIAGDLSYLRNGVRVGPGDVVLDVGANVGVAAVFFARLGAAAVHCFEPVAPVIEILRRNVAGLPACTVHPFALGRRAGRDTLRWYPGAAAMSGRRADPARDRELVRVALANLGTTGADADAQLAGRYEARDLPCDVRRLSDVLAEQRIERIDLLKVDVERDEVDVLDGIDEPDWPRIRQVAMEVHDVAGRLVALEQRLAEQGFRTTTEQDRAMRGTDVHLLHAVRP